MTINYKILSIVLGALLLVSVCFNRYNGHNGYDQKMIGGMKNNTHHMSDGTMMQHTSTNSTSHSMDSMMMDMTARMQGKSGDALDKIFLEDMIIHHQGAVDMAKVLQSGTQRPELQKMAADIIDAQTKEINMMNEWLQKWFK